MEKHNDVRDVNFLSEENQKRDIVLGFIHDKDGKRIGLRILHRDTNTVRPQGIVDDLKTWNLNINNGQFYPKCSKLSDFPVLSLPAGVEGNPMAPDAKLVSKVSGAWVLEEVSEGVFRLVSVSGQMKDVTEATALSFHEKYKIANAIVEEGKLTGVFKKHTKDVFFIIPETGQVEWICKSEDGTGFFWAMFYPHRVAEARRADLEVVEYFKQLIQAIKQDPSIHSKVLSAGDDEYTLVRTRYETGQPTHVGKTVETQKAIADLALNFFAEQSGAKAPVNTQGVSAEKQPQEDFPAKFYHVGETLAKKGYVALWITRSEEAGKVCYTLVYMTKDAISKAVEKALSFVEFFDDGLYQVAGNLYAGDAKFAEVDELYRTRPAAWEGVNEATMQGIIEYALGASKIVSEASEVKNDNLPSQKDSKAVQASGEEITGTEEVPSEASADDLAEMKALNVELKAACAAYYGDGDSPLSDLEYDEKFDKLLALERKTGVILPDSVTQGVGADVVGKLPKVEHPEKVLSLDKTKAVEVLSDLLRQDPDGGTGILSWKMDGLTIIATYEGGVLKRAVTRGNGKIGEDVTHNAKFFKGMPRRIPYTGELRIRGEAVVAYSTFERINASLPEGQEPYKNPRNLASGIVRRSEVTKDGSVEFFPFGVAVTDPKFRPATYGQSLKFLVSQGFNPVFHISCTADDVGNAVDVFKKKIDTFDYPTDGLVLAIDNLVVQEKLGATSHHPRGALAFKWADEKQKTILREIEWSASRTGVLTPVAIFDPVDLEGTTVKRASVHNLTQVRKLKLGIGDEISIYKANMIIPQIAENHTGSDTVQPPAVCPVCGGATGIRKEVKAGSAEPSEFVICTNPDCAAKNVKSLAHFVKREAMNIDGISEKTIEELVAAGYIHSALDFYTLKDHPEIAERPNWGKASYNKMISAIEHSRTTTLAQVIYALGIRNVGRSASEAIAQYFTTDEVAKFLGASVPAASGVDLFLQVMTDTDRPHIIDGLLSEIAGIGQSMRADIIEYFKDNKDFVQKLFKLLVIDASGTSRKAVTLPSNIPQGAPDCLKGLAFCVTGKIEFPGARDALAAYIESLGGRMASSVSKNTNYLITNTPNSGSSKNQAAQKLGCKVISEAAFFTLVKDLSEAITAPEREDNARIEQAIADNPTATTEEIAQVTMRPDKEQIDLSLAELTAEFNRVYGVLYDNKDKVTGYSEALDEGDKFIHDNPNFVGKFANHRGDILSSDREVVAFMMAMKNLKKTQGERIVQQGIDSVVIPEDPREARIQAAEAIRALSGVPLAGLTFCVTGAVEYGTREAFHSFIRSKGGNVVNSVTKGVDYLITNTPFSGSRKNQAARANGCHIISEAEFMKMVETGQRPEDYNDKPKPAAPYESRVYESVRGKTFCITGRVDFPGKRAALVDYIRSLGGYYADSIDYHVDYLITNDPFSGSTKNREAKRHGCKVITEEQFMLMAQMTR